MLPIHSYQQHPSIKGKIDPLVGLKENVIIGKLIPAGTGMKRYRTTILDTDARLEMQAEESISFEEVAEDMELEEDIDELMDDMEEVDELAEEVDEAEDAETVTVEE